MGTWSSTQEPCDGSRGSRSEARQFNAVHPCFADVGSPPRSRFTTESAVAQRLMRRCHCSSANESVSIPCTALCDPLFITGTIYSACLLRTAASADPNVGSDWEKK